MKWSFKQSAARYVSVYKDDASTLGAVSPETPALPWVEEDGVEQARGVAAGSHMTDTTGFAIHTYPGRFGDLAMPFGGDWTYALNNGGNAVQSLRGGEVEYEEFRVFTARGGSETVKIEVRGRNDPAQIAGDGFGEVSRGGAGRASGMLTVSDVDRGEAQARAQYVKDEYGAFDQSTGGKWEYVLDETAEVVKALREGEVVWRDFTVLSQDGTASHMVTVKIVGSGSGAVCDAQGNLHESALAIGTAATGVGKSVGGTLEVPAAAGALTLIAPGTVLTSGGESVQWTSSPDGRTLRGETASRTVLDISLVGDRQWRANLYSAIDHVSDGDMQVLDFGVNGMAAGAGKAYVATVHLRVSDDRAAAYASGDRPWRASAGALGHFGADGGHVDRIELDGAIYDYDPRTGVRTAEPGANFRFDPVDKVLIVQRGFGELTVDMDSGQYTFRGAESHHTPVHFAYSLSDSDGDRSQGAVRFVPTGEPVAPRNETFTTVIECPGEEPMRYGTPGNDFYAGTDGVDKVMGRDGDDIVNGGRGRDVLWADAGFDVLHGGEDDDTLYANRVGFGRLFGDEGDDRFRLNIGRTEMTGGPGRDLFALSVDRLQENLGGERETTITDFTRGEDRFLLESNTNLWDGSIPDLKIDLFRVGQDTHLVIDRYWEPGYSPRAYGSDAFPGAATIIFQGVDLTDGQSSHVALEKLRASGDFIM